MSRTNILLVFGGQSPEHDVSIMSARNIYAAMDNDRYEVDLCYIDRNGKWWLLEAWADDLENHGGVQMLAALGMKAFITIPDNRTLYPTVIYPALHGDTAEDGVLQGLAELLHIPIVGSGVLGHAVGWDKLFTKILVASEGIPIVPYVVHRIGDAKIDYASVSHTLGSTTMYVKPTRAGSSLGVSRVTSDFELMPAIESAYRYSDTILVEKAIVGRELEVAVLGNHPTHAISDVGEIKVSNGFYSYEEKYSSESHAEVLTRADLSEEIRSKAREMSGRIFTILGCKGLARIDFLYDTQSEILYMNEINTLPGFTNISQYPKLWHEQGINYPQLIDKLIDLALQ